MSLEPSTERIAAQASDAAFHWRRKGVWRAALLAMFEKIVTKKVMGHILANPPEFFVSDDLSWVERPAREFAGLRGRLFDEFDCRFPHRFPFIRVFHAGRPVSKDAYREGGLKLVGLEYLKGEAVAIFGESPALRRAMSELENGLCRYTDDTGNKIFFFLDRREAVGGSGHYLKFGSEYLLAIASRLGKQAALEARGIPTLVHVNLPYSWIDSTTRCELMGDMFEDLFCHLAGDTPADDGGLNVAFPICRPVPPELCVRLEIVTKVSMLWH